MEEEEEAIEPENLDREVNYDQRDLVTTVTVTSLDNEDDTEGKRPRKENSKRRTEEEDADNGLDVIQAVEKDQNNIPKAKMFAKSTKKEKEIKVGFHYLGKKIE